MESEKEEEPEALRRCRSYNSLLEGLKWVKEEMATMRLPNNRALMRHLDSTALQALRTEWMSIHGSLQSATMDVSLVLGDIGGILITQDTTEPPLKRTRKRSKTSETVKSE